MELSLDDSGKYPIVSIDGEISKHEDHSERIKEAYRGLVGKGKTKIIFNLENITYRQWSDIWEVILSTHFNLMHYRGKAVFLKPNEKLKRGLKAAKFDVLIDIVENEEEAMKHLDAIF